MARQFLAGRTEVEGIGIQSPDEHARAEAVAAQAVLDPSTFGAVLAALYEASWSAGVYQGAALLGTNPQFAASALGAALSGYDWSAWHPGDGRLTRGVFAQNLSRLMSDAKVWTAEIDGTTKARIARVLETYDEDHMGNLPQLLQAAVRDPMAADKIARTEVNRAMSMGALDVYQIAGLAQWDWMTMPGACALCLAQEAENPHRMGEPEPPGHPNCRCVPIPVR